MIWLMPIEGVLALLVFTLGMKFGFFISMLVVLPLSQWLILMLFANELESSDDIETIFKRLDMPTQKIFGIIVLENKTVQRNHPKKVSLSRPNMANTKLKFE